MCIIALSGFRNMLQLVVDECMLGVHAIAPDFISQLWRKEKVCMGGRPGYDKNGMTYASHRDGNVCM